MGQSTGLMIPLTLLLKKALVMEIRTGTGPSAHMPSSKLEWKEQH